MALQYRNQAVLRCRVTDLDKEIAVIALPALASLAADPIASLVDTAYIGKLGATLTPRLNLQQDMSTAFSNESIAIAHLEVKLKDHNGIQLNTNWLES